MMDPWLSKLEFELDALTYWRKYIKLVKEKRLLHENDKSWNEFVKMKTEALNDKMTSTT